MYTRDQGNTKKRQFSGPEVWGILTPNGIWFGTWAIHSGTHLETLRKFGSSLCDMNVDATNSCYLLLSLLGSYLCMKDRRTSLVKGLVAEEGRVWISKLGCVCVCALLFGCWVPCCLSVWRTHTAVSRPHARVRALTVDAGSGRFPSFALDLLSRCVCRLEVKTR